MPRLLKKYWETKQNDNPIPEPDGIRCASPYNSITLETTTDISGNTGFGVNLAYTVSGLCNLLRVAATATMSANVAGDMTLDGTTVVGLDTAVTGFRALPGKISVDTNRFNRLAAD